MPIFDHFGILAPYYDRVFKPSDRDWLFEMLDLPIEGRILDVGGGTGRIAQLLREQTSQIVVADLSLEMLSQAAKKSGLMTACSVSEAISFRDHAFERVLMVDALHHVYDHTATLKELWRVLKPGGRIVIEEPDIRTWGVKGLAILEKILLMRSHFISPPKIIELLGDLGKSHIEAKGPIAWVIIEKD